MPHASCPVFQGVVSACSAAPVAPVLLVVQHIAVSACPLFWAFAASFIQVNFTQCMLGWHACAVYAGIACLASLAFDWQTACWDSLSRLLHAGIACLASLTFDWLNECWVSLFVLSMLG